jgi:hypothetical protein
VPRLSRCLWQRLACLVIVSTVLQLAAELGELAAGAEISLSLLLRASGPVDNPAVLEVEAAGACIADLGCAAREASARASAEVWVAQPSRAAIGREGAGYARTTGGCRLTFRPGPSAR